MKNSRKAIIAASAFVLVLIIFPTNSFAISTTLIFGTFGHANGQFEFPAAIARDSFGNIFVADASNDRVQKFDSSGNFLSKFGTLGSGNGEFDFAHGIAIDDSDNNIFVVDQNNNRIEKFNPSGHFLTQFGNCECLGLNFPEMVTIDNSGDVLVTDGSNDRVVKFDHNLVFQSDFGSHGTGDGQFDHPHGIAVDTSGNIYVTDLNNNRVQKFDSSGTFLSKFGTLGSDPGQFNHPTGVAVDTAGRIYVSDANNNRIQIFSPSFVFITSFGSSGSGSGQFIFPHDVKLDGSGNIYVADANNNRIQVFSSLQMTNVSLHQSIGLSESLKTTFIPKPSHSSISLQENLGISDSLSKRKIEHGVHNFALQENLGISDSISAFTSVFTSTHPPFITSITAGDPFSHPGLTDGDIITVQFSDQTNQPGGTGLLNKDAVDNILSFSQTLGSDYTGQWIDPSTFLITITDATNNGSPQVGITTANVNPSAHMRNAPTTSPVSTSASPPLGGDFGASPTPVITALVADGTNAIPGSGFRNGDTMTVRFSESTNQPGGTGLLNKDAVDNILRFSQTLGSDYTGQWINPRTFLITITDATNNGSPQVGITTTNVNPSGDLRSADGTSPPSNSISPPLSGSFGAFVISIPVAAGGTAAVVLPTGITASFTLPPTSSGTVTITGSLTASTDGSNGSTLGFLGGKVADVSPPPGACADGCTFSFTFTNDDLIGTNIANPFDVQIFHDHNSDNDFKETDETLATTITQTSPTSFIATATDNQASKFAIGGVVTVLALLGHGGGGGAASPPSFTGSVFAADEYPLSINGQGFKLDNHTNTIPTTTLETGQPVHLKLLMYESAGSFDMQHVALGTNLHSTSPDISNLVTSIVYEKGEPLQITDPNGLFSKANVTTSETNGKFELDYDITFAKPMKKSDIIVRAWDQYKYSTDIIILDALQVEPNSLIKESVSPNVQSNTSVQNNTNALIQQSIQIPTWVKNNAGWWHDNKIGDSDFVKGIQYLITNGIMKIPQTQTGTNSTQQIPTWIKNNAGWWNTGQISDDEFVKGIQYLISNGIMNVG